MDVSEDKRAAVVKRGTEREARDLFATRPPELGQVSFTMPPPAMNGTAADGGYAARNENSVLFTVESIRGAKAKSSATPEAEMAPLSTPRADDDEGVIDLSRLSSTPPSPNVIQVAPLFSEPPGSFATQQETDDAPVAHIGKMRFTKRAIGAIGAGAVALVLGVVGISIAFGGSDANTARSAAANLAVVPPPAVVVTPPPAPAATPDQASASSSTSSASTDDAKSPSVGVSGGKGHKTHAGAKASAKASHGSSSSSSMQSVASTGVSKPGNVKSSGGGDACNCHGDFSCQLRCAAKGK